jgi:hypothetical protein
LADSTCFSTHVSSSLLAMCELELLQLLKLMSFVALTEDKFIQVTRILTLRDRADSNVYTFGFKMDFTFLTSVWQT